MENKKVDFNRSIVNGSYINIGSNNSISIIGENKNYNYCYDEIIQTMNKLLNLFDKSEFDKEFGDNSDNINNKMKEIIEYSSKKDDKKISKALNSLKLILEGASANIISGIILSKISKFT